MKRRSIKFWRQERHVSQYQLADLSDIPRHRLQLYEQGLLDLSTIEIEKICKALGIEEYESEFREVPNHG